MIRFCDKEVQCVLDESVDLNETIAYFMQGHKDDEVCVIHEDGKYVGNITYYSLFKAIDIESGTIDGGKAISRKCVVLDENIWINARHFFAYYEPVLNEHVLLPVINGQGQLTCFAYEDVHANREIRMLRELMEQPDALKFSDIYPDISCVKIHGFNELAYYFAKYLEMQDIPVQVDGDMWEGFFEGKDCKTLDYSHMTLYAEGIGVKPKNWTENLLRSVCVEFECIDKIYEANIKNGIINNANGDWEHGVKEYLCDKKIAVMGTDPAAQDVYDFLLMHGIETYCFVNESLEEGERRLFGKKICTSLELMKECGGDIVFIDGEHKNSAWGNRILDYYDYIGYKRNESYFMIRDYVDVPRSGLKHALADSEIVLIGNTLLCERVREYICKKVLLNQANPVYADILQEEDEYLPDMPMIDIRDIRDDMVCLIVIPEFADDNLLRFSWDKKKRMISHLKEMGINNFTDYFFYTLSFIDIIRELDTKRVRDSLMPKMNMMGSIEAHNGNVFFHGLLDNHPSVMLMDYDFFSKNIFWVSACLANREPKDIVPLLYRVFPSECKEEILPELKTFIKKVEQLLVDGEKYTSQELFVIFHIAYMYIYGKDITAISDKIIYWEPHCVDTTVVEEFPRWLEVSGICCNIVNVVRNICVRNGAIVRDYVCSGFYQLLGCVAIAGLSLEKGDDALCKRYVVKFEDLKCRPRETLHKLCNVWGLPWSETLLEVTFHGKKWGYDNRGEMVYDFDLTPVYNRYEEYFSESDWFRVALINTSWQKKYGYPFVDASEFSQRELQEMFLKSFRFDKFRQYRDDKVRLDDRIFEMNKIRDRIWENRILEFEENKDFSSEKEE